MHRARVDDLVQRLLAELQQADLKARIAASVYPVDGRSPDDLIAATLRALRGSMRSADRTTLSRLGPIIVAPKMIEVYAMIDRVAASNIAVLITGETGTGKEVIAEAVHARSARASKPFVKLNCASVPEQLLEAELFGYEKGAFTGATQTKVGLLEHADGGSVLLDELGEMPLEMQAKLLRVLEDKRIRRVGGLEPIAVDVRIIASTNRDLERMVAAGTFREDLYWRLCGVNLNVPALRERREEILPLAERFLAMIAQELGRTAPTIRECAVELLQSYSWPGNIRQLRNVMERASLLASDSEIRAAHLPQWSADKRPSPGAAAGQPPAAAGSAWVPSSGAPPSATLKEEVVALERERILNALAQAGQNQTRAAELLSMPRRTFVEKLDRYGIERPRKRRT